MIDAWRRPAAAAAARCATRASSAPLPRRGGGDAEWAREETTGAGPTGHGYLLSVVGCVLYRERDGTGRDGGGEGCARHVARGGSPARWWWTTGTDLSSRSAAALAARAARACFHVGVTAGHVRTAGARATPTADGRTWRALTTATMDRDSHSHAL
jgi:hypothetical protein